jgi:hypothetical protein
MVFLNPHESIGLSIPSGMHLSVEKDRVCPFPASCKDASPTGCRKKRVCRIFYRKMHLYEMPVCTIEHCIRKIR